MADPAKGASETAKQADIKVELKGDSLALAPDQALLTAPDTTFPVVIDPIWTTEYKNMWAIAYKHNGIAGSADTPYINGGTLSKEARVGCARDADRNNAVVCAKTFFHVDTRTLWDKQIIESTLRIKQNYAGSYSCQSGEIQVWDTSGIKSNTTWNNQPSWASMIDASGKSFGGRNCPTGGGEDLVEFNVTTATRLAAERHWGFWAFGLKSATDTVDVSWRRLAPETARISTQYNTPPATPGERSTDPYAPCQGGTIGQSDFVTLRARVWDDEDNQVTAEFHYWKDGAAWPTVRNTTVVRGNIASVQVSGNDLADGTYVWDVRAHDGRDISPWAGQCRFTVDKSRPSSPPRVTSAEFPNGDGGTWGNPARTGGQFTFDANGETDVVKYEWYTDFDTRVATAAAPSPGAAATVSFTPLSVGPQHLYVVGVDAAGNRSDLRNYLFYASRATARDDYGDLNGDHNPDLWAVDKDGGQLRVHPGQGDGTFGLSADADNSSFAGAVITHRGDWGEDGYEDLIALKQGPDGNPALVRRNNDGRGILQNRDVGEQQFLTYTPEYRTWDAGGQVLSLGSVDDDNGDGTVDGNDNPDLLVLSAGKLWLYYGTKSQFLDEREPPVAIGGTDWGNKTIMTPGDTDGDGLPELWVRETDTGNVYAFPSGKDDVGNFNPASYANAQKRVKIGTGFTAAAYPQLTSDGDLEKFAGGTSYPDLWGTDPQGRVYEFPGKTLSGESAFGPPRALVTNSRSWSDCQAFTGPATGTHTLCGPILSKYLALGGPATSALGYPTTDVTTPPDGTGRYANFQDASSTSPNGSIYWSPGTGAWSVRGSIRAKWATLGWEQGILGYPIADEQSIPGAADGWISTFAGSPGNAPGAITHTASAGTHEIHGGIYVRYMEMGGPRAVGYPSTDETATSAAKPGRYNHLRWPGQSADYASIYWSQQTGAWHVQGGIRTAWANAGWENSWLGFPPRTNSMSPTGAEAASKAGTCAGTRPTSRPPGTSTAPRYRPPTSR
ncbi:FG-GAP-like repeat-containing protein [Uniformispora flossi]|uniref:FG-GAP-like repeat-containing protein n=1 Tax=Uniformispora flossi TaxID=3390723 RepID=UPI003C2B1B1F